MAPAQSRKGISKNGKIALAFGGIVIVGGLAFWFFNRAKAQKTQFNPPSGGGDTTNTLPTTTTTTKPTTTSSSSGSSGGGSTQRETDRSFPLKRGMKGQRIKLIQRGLNTELGAGLVVDGIWGPKTQRALDNAKVDTPITPEGYGRILAATKEADPYGFQPGGSSAQAGGKTSQGGGSFSPADLAMEIANGTNRRDSSRVINALKQMVSPQDYRNVSSFLGDRGNDRYETRDKFGGRVNRNLVNTLMASRMPWNFSQRQAFASQLTRMGLRKDANDTWHLSGLGAVADSRMGKQAVTVQPTQIWGSTEPLQRIGPGILVGTVVDQREGVTTVITPIGKRAFVPTQSLVTA
ncbi:MAG: hypothetical protein AAF998_10550 [Bacteroidota bacterium]